MLGSLHKCVLVAVISATPLLLCGCGPDDGNNKFTTSTVVSTPAAPAHADYKALLLNDQ